MRSQSELRTHALNIFQAGVAAADPYQAVKNHLQATNHRLEIVLNDDTTRVGDWSKVHLIAFGKAACAMAKAAHEVIPQHLISAPGIVVTNYENVAELEGFEVIGAGHPLPDEKGLKAARRIAERAMSAKQGELVLVLVSGGGSALIPYPVESISLQEKIATTDLLLSSGATINQINCVRKHLSRLKGGGLIRWVMPADLHALILSDVLGDDLSSIASGATVPDDTTYSDAINVLKNKVIWDKVPNTVRKHLEQGQQGLQPETPKSNDGVFNNASQSLIGSNTVSLRAMLNTAQHCGYETQTYSEQLCGEARKVAEQWVLVAKQINKPLALLAGGETTVTVTGTGLGGRNQELALAFALATEQHGLTGRWAFLSGGTDGRDGPTDAAGGLVDQNSIQRMRDHGIDPAELLDNNDAYRALQASNDLLITGATGTNVADLQVLLLTPEQ
jgi:hydroxypyruvate reductase